MGKILKSQIKKPRSYLNIAIKYRSQIVFYKWDRETRNATLRLYPQRQNTHSKTRTSAVTAHAATQACENFITPKKCFDFKRSKNLNRWPVEVRAMCIGLVAPKTYSMQVVTLLVTQLLKLRLLPKDNDTIYLDAFLPCSDRSSAPEIAENCPAKAVRLYV